MIALKCSHVKGKYVAATYVKTGGTAAQISFRKVPRSRGYLRPEMASKRRKLQKPARPKSARVRLADLLRTLGAKGGSARAKNMTAAERSEAARRAVAARWAKAKKA